MKNSILLLIAILFSFGANAQTQVNLKIAHKLSGANFAFNQSATNSMGHIFDITRIDYYISNITIIHDGGLQTKVPDSVIFVQGSANVNENLGSYSVTNVEGIKFYIGVDSLTNATVEPTTAPAPLDAKSPPMWWGWNSGYRFVAIHGNGTSTLDKTFQFHSLFDDYYYSQTQMSPGVATTVGIDINLSADYTQALKGIVLNTGLHEHGAKQNDITVLQNFRDFVFAPAWPTAVTDVNDNKKLQVYPNPSTGIVHISLDGINATKNMSVIVYSILGRQIMELSIDNQQVDFQLDTKGMYFVQLVSEGKAIANQKIIIQ